ncbi:hypothetical protein AB0P36_34135 [Streptomyces flavidovirens]|uniref:hypothetical protein n=1 Tax=Streptomyces flavidovirens TaxID=67298 RepID=UPI0034484BDE
MSDRLPFSSPGRVLDGQQLQKGARAVAEEGLWADMLQHRTDDGGYAEVFFQRGSGRLGPGVDGRRHLRLGTGR